MDDLKIININEDLIPEERGRNGYSPKTGFQSPTDDHVELDINWNTILKKNSIFHFTVQGFSMMEANILPGDILFCDRSLDPKNGSIVFVAYENNFTVRYYYKQGERLFLKPANPKYKTIEVRPGDNYSFEGVISFILYKAQLRVS